MYAKVIVDVPAKQTNRAFDYRIPARLREWVDIGSRVGVPFGPRIVQGFVVEIGDRASVDENKVKEIDHVLDVSPPLTPELVELARWISRKYLCHEITALQAMLPGALKAKYVRRIQVSDDCPAVIQGSLFGEESEIAAFVREKGGVSMEALMARFPSLAAVIKRMIREGVLLERQIIRDRHVPKKVLTVFPPDPELLRQYMEKVPASAPRQKEVLQYFLHHPEPVKMADLVRELSVNAATVRGLAEKGWIVLKTTEEFRDPFAHRTFPMSEPLPLTAEQRHVFEQIRDSLTAERHEVFLLHGVTGSGKTEVYLQSIQQCLDQGREAIVLVPEISLTPQMVERFKSRFGDQVAVLHSRLSDGERYDEWRKIIQRKVRVAIGARSAVFAPFTRLGLIIIDEEHESSYKQEESPKYHAREVAIRRGRNNRAAVVLGSATPSLESYYLATAGPVSRANRPGAAVENRMEEGEETTYRLLSLSSRVHGRPLPPVHVVDMREELKSGNRSMFSRALYHALKDRLEKNEQAVLLLNRRGYATFVLCRSCGAVIRCPHCDISLTYHQTSNNLRCHYCGYAERETKRCPDCGSEHIRHFGTGTQRVEEELGRLFPGIRVIRMDVDTTTEKGSHEKWLTMFRRRQADVLLGTQMVAKGLDFPFVTLVGVVAADTMLNLPDFRSAEKTFQLLTQVAGRAGRHELPGEVIVQTYTPEHYSIHYASRHDYAGFINEELAMRRMRGYPPYRKLALITLSHEELPFLVRSAEILARRLRELCGGHSAGSAGDRQRQHHRIPEIRGENVEIFGPIASPIPRIKDRYRFQCMIKYQSNLVVSHLITQALLSLEEQLRQNNLQINVDVDPQVLL